MSTSYTLQFLRYRPDKLFLPLHIPAMPKLLLKSLSQSVSHINAYLWFKRIFTMTTKNVRRMIIFKRMGKWFRIYPLSQKFSQNHFISHHFQDKHIFIFNQKCKMGTGNGGGNDFFFILRNGKVPKNLPQIAPCYTVFK